MCERIAGPLAKVERAKQHLEELNAAIGEFFASNPYEVVTDEDTEPGKRHYKLAKVDPVPKPIVLITGDAIHNLRAALDHLFCHLVEANRNTISTGDMFPVADSAKLFESTRIPQIKTRVSKDALDLITRLKPYKGGFDAIWRLHKLDIADKHRLLYFAGSAFRAVRPRFPPLALPGEEPINISDHFPDLFLRPADRMFPLKEGDILYVEPSDFESNDEAQFRFDVAFSESEVIQGEPISETLNQLIGATKQTIELFRPIL